MRTLDQMIAAAEPGQPVAKFAEIARESLSETSVHPIVGRSFGHAIGLDINEPPNFTLDAKNPTPIRKLLHPPFRDQRRR